MKLRLLVLFAFFSLLLNASEMEERFQELKTHFELRNRETQKELKQYLIDFPYTTYRSETQLMIGILQTEKGKYKNALTTFDKVEWKQLERQQQPMFYFYRGYAYMHQDKFKEAAACFKTLRDSNNPYALQGKYYYAYCWYLQGDYNKALPEFLGIEHTNQYKKIVPYYIIQIYYAQGNYDEVYDRAKYLLENNPGNENNGEIHRILGEIYYSQGKYDVAANNLSEYKKLFTEQNKTLVREDIYLLAMSEYQQQHWQEAVSQFKQVKELKDTISESTCLHLGNAYIKLNDVEKAKLSYAAAARFNFTPAIREEAMYNYALTTYQTGTALGENIQAFNDFLKAYPNTKHATQVYQLLADMYMNSKNYAAAYKAINEIPNPSQKLQDTKQYLRYQLGADAFLQGKMGETRKWMSEVIQNESGTSSYKTEAYYYRAECQYRLHEYEACYADIMIYKQQRNASQSKNIANVDYLAGYALFSLKQYNEAETMFRQFITSSSATEPMYADALNRIGDCCFNARAFADAADTYQRVIDLNSTGIDYALFQRGYALGLMRRYHDKAGVMEQLVNQYAKSDYADDALYEIARAHLQEDNTGDAINAYNRLIQQYPNSNLARKASLELGMSYQTQQQYDDAINAFKHTIQNYPGSEEAYAALEGMEQICVETNRISEYLAYTKQLGKMNMNISNQEDSLTFAAAELQYMLGNYKQAAGGLSTYLSQYCSGGRYCTMATYYAADSYYRLEQYDDAIVMYKQLAEITGNPYIEEACTRVASISFDNKDYQTALPYFQRMKQLSTKRQNTITAQLGILRCNYFLNDYEATIQIATEILSDDQVAKNVREEALYNRAKALLKQEKYGLASVDLTPLAKDVRIVTGAEAKYLLAYCNYQMGAIDSSEEEIMSFASMKTQHQYWLAKSMILLADINVQRGELFQAKQYLLSLQSNYKVQDDIQQLVADKLQVIEQMEQQTPIVEEEEEL